MPSNMKSAVEATKGGKRKGTRSVSTLTPAQLARKRANDREAQRAIRARTKEHIETLEKEIEELRSQHDRDATIQNLLRRNKALEDEIRRMRENTNMHSNDPCDAYQPMLHSSSPPRHPFGHGVSSYPMVPNITTSYSNMSDATDPWAPGVACSISSIASSPSSSGGTDDFGNNYIPTSNPSTAFERSSSSMPPNTQSPNMSCEPRDGPFDNMKSDFGCSQMNIGPLNTGYHFQPWNMYPMQYQAPSAGLDHGHQMSQIGRCQF
ncbi:hypothetical protein F4819DRAFT_487929 [Hypoxylon fuscum]|nr:hypothetical protein F4819DRAFT_487929 [Hypoxylon fuscum]